MPIRKRSRTSRGKKHNFGRIGARQEKILLMLCAGIALGFTYTPRQYIKLLEEFQTEWKAINKQSFIESVKSLHESGYVTYIGSKRGAVMVELTPKGRKEAERRSLKELRVPKPPVWDGRWHVVAFDIPVKLNNVRSTFRRHLKHIGFIELQRSIFIHPFPPRDEVETIASHYNIHKYITYMRIDTIENEEKLIRHFKLRC